MINTRQFKHTTTLHKHELDSETLELFEKWKERSQFELHERHQNSFDWIGTGEDDFVKWFNAHFEPSEKGRVNLLGVKRFFEDESSHPDYRIYLPWSDELYRTLERYGWTITPKTSKSIDNLNCQRNEWKVKATPKKEFLDRLKVTHKPYYNEQHNNFKYWTLDYWRF